MTVQREYYFSAVFHARDSGRNPLQSIGIDGCTYCSTRETFLATDSQLFAGRNHNHGKVVDSVLIGSVHFKKEVVVRGSVRGSDVSVASRCVPEAYLLKSMIINGNSEVCNMILHDSIQGDSMHPVGPTRQLNVGDHCVIETHG